MLLNFTLIDLPRTLLLLAVLLSVAAAAVFDVLPRLAKVRVGHWLILLAVFTAALGLIAKAATSATDGLFGETTAAWIQAVGSVAAIIGAIWVDQGAARRLRQDRDVAMSDAIGSRRSAIGDMAVEFVRVRDLLAEWDASPSEWGGPATWTLTEEYWEEAEVALGVLRFYLAQQGEIDARLVSLISRAERTAAGAIGRFNAFLPLSGQAQKVAGLKLLDDTITEFHGFLAC
jgi:hypothetical protein